MNERCVCALCGGREEAAGHGVVMVKVELTSRI